MTNTERQATVNINSINGKASVKHKPEDLPGSKLIAGLSGEKPEIQAGNALRRLSYFLLFTSLLLRDALLMLNKAAVDHKKNISPFLYCNNTFNRC